MSPICLNPDACLFFYAGEGIKVNMFPDSANSPMGTVVYCPSCMASKWWINRHVGFKLKWMPMEDKDVWEQYRAMALLLI